MKEIYDLLILALLWRIVLRFNGEALPAVVIDNKLYLNTTYGIGVAYTFMKFYRWAEEGGSRRSRLDGRLRRWCLELILATIFRASVRQWLY